MIFSRMPCELFRDPLAVADRKVDDPVPANAVLGSARFALVVQELVALGDIVGYDSRQVLIDVVHNVVGAAAAAAQAHRRSACCTGI